ncbi:MAG: AAA family ATPase [Nitrososphaerota archaeon]
MIIHSVRLRNFISHRDTFIEFPQGLTVLVGDNGSGKTSILDAITFALFKEHGRGRDENLINRAASSAIVQVTFSSGGRAYEVTWRLGRGRKTQATLRDLTSGATLLVDAGERTVLPEIERILGIPREVFLSAAYVRQGEMAKLLEARPSERKEIISRLLGIEELERLWEELRMPIRLLEEKAADLRKRAEGIKELEKRLGDVEAEISRARERLTALESEVKALEEERERLESELRAMEENRRRIEGLKEAVAKLDNLIASRRRDLESHERDLAIVREAEKRALELERAEEELRRLRDEVENLRREISELEAMKARKEVLEKRLGEISGEMASHKSLIEDWMRKVERISGRRLERFDELPNALRGLLDEHRRSADELERKIRRIDEEVGSVQGMMRAAMEKIEELERGGAACPLCRRPMTEEHRLRVLNELRAEIEDYERRARALEIEREELHLDLESARAVLKEFSGIDPDRIEDSISRIRELEEERARIEAELRSIEEPSRLEDLKRILDEKMTSLRRAEEEVRRLERERGILEKLGSSMEVEKRVRRLASEIAELEEKKRWMIERMRSIRYSEEEYEDLRRRLKNALERLGCLREEYSALSQRLKDLEDERSRIAGEVEDAKLAGRRLEIVERELARLRAIRDAFSKDGVQKHIRAAARKSIEYYARSLLRSFNLAYTDLRLDEDYNVYVYGPFGEQPIDSLSGGEKTAVALCLRLGIAAALTGNRIQCILMDEPTTHLDPDRRRELVRLLSNLRGERGLIPQAIIVTHDQEVEQAADHVYRVEIEDGSSRVERA